MRIARESCYAHFFVKIYEAPSVANAIVDIGCTVLLLHRPETLYHALHI